MDSPVIVIGAGGHAKVLIDILKLKSVEILGIVLPKSNTLNDKFYGYPIIGDDEVVLEYLSQDIKLVNALGSVRSTDKRKAIFERFKRQGYNFTSVIHPSAIISSDSKLSEGIQVMAGVIIQAGCTIGENTILNTKASIDHDCLVGQHVHVAPGVTISGNVSIGECTHIGTGATIIQGIRIGANVTVAAGGVVVKNISDGLMVKGVPAGCHIKKDETK